MACVSRASFCRFFARASALNDRPSAQVRATIRHPRNESISPPMPRAPINSSVRPPPPESGAEPVLSGGARGKDAGAAGPAQVRLQVNVIVGEQVFPGAPFEISAEALVALRRQMGPGVFPPGVVAGSDAFALRRSEGVWQVLFEREQDFFGHTTGMTFIEHYLKHPGEPIHPVALLARLQGEEPVQQRSTALDDQDATDDYLRQMDRLRAAIKDEKTSPGKRKVAEEDLAQLEQADDYIYYRTFDKAARAAKSVRQAMNRSISLLEEARDALGRPHPVLVRFAAHVKKYLLGASLAKGVPTGCLVYEPPAGVRWG